jgi:site-specific DNA-methyltransferase (adenine-specific)
VLDFFAGSGTTGAACVELGRRFILVDDNIEAMRVMERRFAAVPDIEWFGYTPGSGEAGSGDAVRAVAGGGK